MIPVQVDEVKRLIGKAAGRAGRPVEDITLMAAVKSRSPEEIREVLAAGIVVLGENRIQEGLAHLEALGLPPRPTFRAHFIGRLQTNKARRAVQAFDSIDSVDGLRLAQGLSRLARECQVRHDIMLEVNLGEESQKGGVAPEDTQALAESVHALPGLTLTGLMGVCPYDEDPRASRPFYRTLAQLFHRVRRDHPRPEACRWLSMGMSHDFEVAVEEGATLVRVGQALFGPRRPA
jgi:pyridoxal phosphate enzyme (YggS family)